MDDLNADNSGPSDDLAVVETMSEAPAGAAAAEGASADDVGPAPPLGRMPPEERRCTAVTHAGHRCTRWRVDGYEQCTTHAPDNVRAAIEEAAANDPKKAFQRYVRRSSTLKLDDPTEVRKVLAAIIEGLLLGELEPKIADSATRGCRALLDSLRNDKTAGNSRHVVDVKTKRTA